MSKAGKDGEGGGGYLTTIDLAGTYQYVTVTPGDIIINITCLPDENEYTGCFLLQ